ncbi:MurR/RpiR family transcriptional regulator [Allokutzneria sp. A3M-2-11 16]|uniref:MurR/RpiR family transcriptional regulator n=1 Tax=Allokutzneria sp. A3M-2-11 16 TaxID=2962043 RepID=UPI0020B8181E|nr:MurR/RpiR family transcriptional regulator [Allokutzneria sp. A3M-2-11 16]MCP3805491.1 MurR/RpiR family transcriptional regulator [Allokutzneria sp. A3M-2-11 16]
MHEDSPEDSYESWLRGRVPPGGLSAKSTAVLDVLISQPRRASFGSTADIAELAGVNVATVTRAAQALNFAGWPALQQHLRARYLSALTAPEVAAEHGDSSEAPCLASLRRDAESLVVSRRLPAGTFDRIARSIAGARDTLVIASGSYAAVGTALAHNIGLAGYPATLITNVTELANASARITADDVLIAISFWRLYESTVRAAQLARDRGATVYAVSDAASPALTEAADDVVLVPAEGVAFFPSLTAGTAVAHAIVAQLAAIDPDHTRAAVQAAEDQWANFTLLHRSPRRS